MISRMNQIVRLGSYKEIPSSKTKACLFASLISAFMSAYSYRMANLTKHEVDFRKQQLKKPVYKLSKEEMIHPPWNKSNIKQWLYRRVQVAGRPIHRNCCMIPRMVADSPGFEYVVPLLVREDEGRLNQEGIIFSKGYIPFIFKNPQNRERIQDVSEQTFIGFVSQLSELQNLAFTAGNATKQGRLKYNYADIEDFVESSGFINKQAAKLAMVQKLHQTGIIDERNSQRYENDCVYTKEYPYAKTESGALQLQKMPWSYKNDTKRYMGISIFSLLVGASLF